MADLDPIWNYAQRVAPNRWTCNFCGEQKSGGPKKIKAHLAKIGNYGIAVCSVEVPQDVRNQAAASLENDYNKQKAPSSSSFPLSKKARSSAAGIGPSHLEAHNEDDLVIIPERIGFNDLYAGGTESGIDSGMAINPSDASPTLELTWEELGQLPGDTDTLPHFPPVASSSAHNVVSHMVNSDPSPTTEFPLPWEDIGPLLGDADTLQHLPPAASSSARNVVSDMVNSGVDPVPVDDALSLAEKHCRDGAFSKAGLQKRLEVLQLVRGSDTLVISGKMEGFDCLGSLTIPPSPEVRKLSLDRCSTMSSLLGSGPTTLSKLQNLREIVIENCLAFEEIASPSTIVDAASFSIESIHVLKCPLMTVCLNPLSISLCQYLTTIRVQGCGSLVSILPLVAIPDSLSRLRSLEVAECPKIKVLLPSGWLPRLVNLRKLTVAHCEHIEVIVGVEEAAGEEAGQGKGNLSKLREIHLTKLPAMKSISNRALGCNELESVEVSGCPQLKRIPMLEGIASPLPSLKLKLDKDSWEKMEWFDPEAKTRFERFLKHPK